MEMFVIDFKGSLIVQAASEEDAREKADIWAALLEEKAPKLLLPEVTAVTLRAFKEPDRGAEKRRKDKIKEKLREDGGKKKKKK